MENPGEKHSEARKHAITSYENKETARESCGKRKPKDVESETGNIYRNGKWVCMFKSMIKYRKVRAVTN